MSTPTTAALPPSPPPSKRRGMGSLRSMVISMLVLTALLLAFVAIVPRPDKVDRLPVDSVAAVANARTLGKQPFAAVTPLPAGWSANNAVFRPVAGVPTWAVGYLHDDQYSGLVQAAGATTDWFTAQTRSCVADGNRVIGGATWEQWVNRSSGERRLVHRGSLATVVVSSGSYDDAAAFLARLTPAPR